MPEKTLTSAVTNMNEHTVNPLPMVSDKKSTSTGCYNREMSHKNEIYYTF